MTALIGLLSGVIVFSLATYAREGRTRAAVAVMLAWCIAMLVGAAIMYAGVTRVSP